jgi:hypothetical protein
MNLKRDKNFKLLLNSKKNKFKLDMETIDVEDSLTLMISLSEENERTEIG